MVKQYKHFALWLSLWIFLTTSAEAQEGFKVIALQPNENQILLLPPAGRTSRIKTGNTIAEGQFKLVQVLPDRAVFRDMENGDMVWLWQTERNAVSKVERIKSPLNKGELEKWWDSLFQ